MTAEITCGIYEGEVCNRNNCKGIVAEHPVENCSCHLYPPCSACMTPRNYCATCGWEEADDVIINDHVVNVNRDTGTYRMWTERPLDPTKLDYRNKSHTHFTMIKEGVYPEGMTIEEVRKEVDGTFGGRFEYFDKGKFKFIAYTD